MHVSSIIAFLLIVGLMIKEISYFTPHMIFTYKSILDWGIFGCGILILVFLTVRFASDWFQMSFGVIGIIAFSAMWIKQGVSVKGVLTIARGQEFFPWEAIGYVKIEEDKGLVVSWLKKDGSLLLKQKYSKNSLSGLRERIKNHEIKEM